MYKLTYDSDENQEVNAPGTIRKSQKSSTETKMKADVKDGKDGLSENTNPKEKKNSTGTYEGNGRYYSLFANENFLTEDKAEKQKCCRVGVKSVSLLAIIILLIFAIFGLMWVVRGMQVRQDSLEHRIRILEDSSLLNRSPFNLQTIQQGDAVQHPEESCCNRNMEQIAYLDDVLKGHQARFEDMDEKIRAYRRSGNVQAAQISRNIAQNADDVRKCRDAADAVKQDVSQLQATVDAAKNLVLFATKDASLTENEIDEYLRELGGSSREGTVFAVAHAMGSSYTIPDYPSGATTDSVQYSPPSPVYDISSDFSPIVSFTENDMDPTGSDASVQPESGTFAVRETGIYFLSVSFCVETHRETTVKILRNGQPLREFTVTGEPVTGNNLQPVVVESPPGFDEILNDEDRIAIPPLPPTKAYDDDQSLLRPYQFNHVASLEANDQLQMSITQGSLAEYTHFPGTGAVKSCTRFSGFRI